METAFAGQLSKNNETWVREGSTGTIRLAIGKDQRIPKGFKTEVLANGRRIGEVAIQVIRLCHEGCHAEVRLADVNFKTIVVATDDIAPLAKV